MKDAPPGFYTWLILADLAALVLAGALWYFGVPGRLFPPQRRRRAPWTEPEIFAAWLSRWFWAVLVSAALRAAGFFVWMYGPDFDPTEGSAQEKELATVRFNLWLSAFAFPFAAASIVILLRVFSGTRPYQLGLTGRHAGRCVLLGLLAWMVLTPAVHSVNVLAYQLYARLGVPTDQHPFSRLGSVPLSLAEQVALAFAVLVAAPVVEELLFRGVLQPWLARRRWGGFAAMGGALFLAVLARSEKLRQPWPDLGVTGVLHELTPALFVVAMVPGFLWVRRRYAEVGGAVYGVALLFAVVHANAWPQPVALFVLALGLGYLAYRTQSLVGPVVLHSLFNGVALAVLLVGSPSEADAQPFQGASVTGFEIDRHGQFWRDPQRHRRQRGADGEGFGPDVQARPGIARDGTVRDRVEGCGGRGVIGEVQVQHPQHFGVQVLLPLGDHVHDHDADLLLQVGDTLGGEGLAVTGAVLVRRADQFDRGHQTLEALVVVHPDLDHVEVGNIDFDADRRFGRRPDGGGDRPVVALRRSCLSQHRRDIDFHPRAEVHARFGVVARRQRAEVELLGHVGGPGVMEAFPFGLARHGRTEMVEQGHVALLS